MNLNEKAAKKFRIDYKYKEKNNAYANAWEHNFSIVTAETEAQARAYLEENWTADSELVIKSIERV